MLSAKEFKDMVMSDNVRQCFDLLTKVACYQIVFYIEYLRFYTRFMNLHVNTCIVLNKKSLIRCKTISTGRKTVLFPKGEHFAGQTFDGL